MTPPADGPLCMTATRTTTINKVLLLVEEDAEDARILLDLLTAQLQDTELLHASCMSEAEKYLALGGVNIVLLSLGVPDVQGLGAVHRIHTVAPDIPVVLLVELKDEPLVSQALREGAHDCLFKGQIEARGLLRALRNARERKILEDAFCAERERAEVALRGVRDGVICTDLSGNVTFVNFAAEMLTGCSRALSAGRPMAEVLRTFDDMGHETNTELVERAVSQNGTVYLPPNGILIRRDGREIPIEGLVIPTHDRSGRATGAVSILRDMTEARAIAVQIVHSAEHDMLTGLPNRMLLNERTNRAIGLARLHMQHVAVLLLDLDGFKYINDSVGRPLGDKLLQSVAERLAGCIRCGDTVSHQGDDEFVILLEGIRQQEVAAATASRLLRAVALPHSIDGEVLHVTTTIGISVFPNDGLDAQTLIQNADTAMYHAKESGRRGYQFFNPAMNDRVAQRRTIEESLRCALERNEFEVHYQPKIDLSRGVIIGAEALLRWTHPTRGPISPAEFIPVAEECGLILPIGNWVLREACRQARAWKVAGLPDATVAVNVSAVQLRDNYFLRDLLAILAETHLEPCALELELTESVLVTRIDSTSAILRIAQGRGVQVSLDDFGTGHSSLSYLRTLPINAFKIDQSFIRQVTSHGDVAGMVTALISMGHSLGLRVIAEGVETADELQFLHAHQCDEAQGFYWSPGLPATQFAQLLASGTPQYSGGKFDGDRNPADIDRSVVMRRRVAPFS
jgi:diguanylate cyclase (GGDEF)-like protein/PAS domain S-box-containing protein